MVDYVNRTPNYIIYHVNLWPPPQGGPQKNLGIKCVFLLTKTMVDILFVATSPHVIAKSPKHSINLNFQTTDNEGNAKQWWFFCAISLTMIRTERSLKIAHLPDCNKVAKNYSMATLINLYNTFSFYKQSSFYNLSCLYEKLANVVIFLRRNGFNEWIRMVSWQTISRQLDNSLRQKLYVRCNGYLCVLEDKACRKNFWDSCRRQRKPVYAVALLLPICRW